MDPKASNFSYEAQKDDGSCDYGGCTDPNALNFDEDALYNNGTCRYLGDVKLFTRKTLPGPDNNKFISVLVAGEYIGSISATCNTQTPVCTTGCSAIIFSEKSSGSYSYRYYEITQTNATVFDTIFISSPKNFQVIGGKCTAIIIE